MSIFCILIFSRNLTKILKSQHVENEILLHPIVFLRLDSGRSLLAQLQVEFCTVSYTRIPSEYQLLPQICSICLTKIPLL